MSLFLHTLSASLKVCRACLPYFLSIVPATGSVRGNLNLKINNKTRVVINIPKSNFHKESCIIALRDG